MLSAKPLASLSSGLLARKGQARPAMRRQGMASLASLSSAGDDLGWNDMGDAGGEPLPLPPVLEERQQLAEALAPESEPSPDTSPEPTYTVEAGPQPVSVSAPVAASAPPPAVAAPVTAGRKAAFTLRLDAERHLRLRLASAARGRSAQLLLTEALDTLLAAMPEIDALRGQLPAPSTRGK